jgi:hypothetical protein
MSGHCHAFIWEGVKFSSSSCTNTKTFRCHVIPSPIIKGRSEAVGKELKIWMRLNTANLLQAPHLPREGKC